MILILTFTIYGIVKKCVTINNKENSTSILLSITFVQTQSYFIAFDFTMKSFPIIVFYFRWRLLVDTLTLNFQIVYNVLKIVKTKKFKNKNCFFFHIFLLYTLTTWYFSSPRVKEIFRLNIRVVHYWKFSMLIFHFHFKNKILLRIGNIYNPGEIHLY